AESVREGVDKNSQAAETLLKHLDEVALNVKGITGGQANDDLRKSLANIRDITDGVRSLVGKGGNELDETGQKVRTTLDKISFAIDSLNKTLLNTQQLSEKVSRGECTVGRLLNEDTIANNVEQITTD